MVDLGDVISCNNVIWLTLDFGLSFCCDCNEQP
jgi:hypothetical protein